MIRRFLLLLLLIAGVITLIGCSSSEEPAVPGITMADIEGTWIGEHEGGARFELEISPEDDLCFGGEMGGWNENGVWEGSEEIDGCLVGSDQFIFFFVDGSTVVIMVMELQQDGEIAGTTHLIKNRSGVECGLFHEGEFVLVRR